MPNDFRSNSRSSSGKFDKTENNFDKYSSELRTFLKLRETNQGSHP